MKVFHDITKDSQPHLAYKDMVGGTADYKASILYYGNGFAGTEKNDNV